MDTENLSQNKGKFEKRERQTNATWFSTCVHSIIGACRIYKLNKQLLTIIINYYLKAKLNSLANLNRLEPAWKIVVQMTIDSCMVYGAHGV